MSNEKNVTVKAVVLEQASEKVRELRAIELPDTGFGPQLSLDDGASKPFNFGVLKGRKVEQAEQAIKQFNAKHKDYVAKPRVAKASAITQEDISSALASTQDMLAKYKK